MEFPWWKKEQRVQLLSNQLNPGPWCHDARLVYVVGTGALRWEDCGPGPEWSRNRVLFLGDTPLLSRQETECPTCADLLAVGWGSDTADCRELSAVREVLNGGFSHLEDAIQALTPLLALLPTGLYVIADGDAYPTDGGGRFFWDVPDGWTTVEATAPAFLNDSDFELVYTELPPVFLYPSQQRSRFDPDRAAYYGQRLQQNGPPPRGLALHCAGGVSLLLDGHHKAAAAARLGRMLPCLTVIPFTNYTMKPGRLPGRWQRDRACFGPFAIPVETIPAKWRPEPGKWSDSTGDRTWVGRLADREWPAEYRAAGRGYPTAKEYALVTAADIGYPSDEDLHRWLERPERYRKELRSALVLLRRGDSRRKPTALRCAGLSEFCPLKEQAFRVLASLHGDPEAEAFFIQYFVEQEAGDPSPGANVLTDIAHSFWN